VINLFHALLEPLGLMLLAGLAVVADQQAHDEEEKDKQAGDEQKRRENSALGHVAE
jgi:hypothetical protein